MGIEEYKYVTFGLMLGFYLIKRR